VTHCFALEEADAAYALLGSDAPSLGILLRYGEGDAATDDAVRARTVALESTPTTPGSGSGGDGFLVLGAGNYAARVLVPAFRSAGARLATIVSGTGGTAADIGRRNGFAQASTDARAALADPATGAVVVATRHDLHAAQVLEALRAGKHVFCEKPLCLHEHELDAIAAEARARPGQRLMVGFNRRFAPQVRRMAALLAGVAEPRAMVMTVNAGALPAGHWTLDPVIGGGRLVGEGCHFIDLMRHLANAPVVGWHATPLGGMAAQDSASVSLAFADGSTGTLHYLANGSAAFPKERLEVFCAGRILQLDNFRRLRAWGWPGASGGWAWRQDKGQQACAAAFVAAVRGGPAPIALDELLEVSRVAILAQAALSAGRADPVKASIP
jgi:predicted dehydrogenase